MIYAPGSRNPRAATVHIELFLRRLLILLCDADTDESTEAGSWHCANDNLCYISHRLELLCWY